MVTELMEEVMELRDNNILDLSGDEEIYRIFSVARLIEILKSNFLVLLKPRKWDDPFENVMLKQIAKDKQGRNVHFDEIHGNLYGQCWSLTAESDAMWRIYSPHKDGVKVKTTVRKLFYALFGDKNPEMLVRMFIGKVRYFQEDQIISALKSTKVINSGLMDSSGRGVADTLLIKRKEFIHEDEVRVVFNGIELLPDPKNNLYQFQNDKDDPKNNHYKFRISPTDLFDEIILDPRLEDDNYLKAESEIKALYPKKIEKSKLYRLPKIDLQFD